MRDVALEGYRQEGIRYFGKGCVPIIIRALPMEAVAIVCYEELCQVTRDW